MRTTPPTTATDDLQVTAPTHQKLHPMAEPILRWKVQLTICTLKLLMTCKSKDSFHHCELKLVCSLLTCRRCCRVGVPKTVIAGRVSRAPGLLHFMRRGMPRARRRGNLSYE